MTNKRGGKRTGAGRKPANTVRTTLYIPRHIREQFANNKEMIEALQAYLETKGSKR